MPTPQSYYVSPLDRALHTAKITFHDLDLDPPYRPIVKELLREGNGIHTCDRRSTKSYIKAEYPSYEIEEDFTEQDELWVSNLRESTSAHTARLQLLLDDVFNHDDSTLISMTSHGGSISAILRVLGHRAFPLRTGAAIPVLLKVEQVPGRRPETEIEPWEPKPECKEDPKLAGRAGWTSLNHYAYDRMRL